MLQTALAYLHHGWSVFPLLPMGKTPAIPTWKQFMEKQPTESLVRTWWTNCPAFNIGIATGAVSGVVVVDCDTPESVNAYLQHPEYIPTLNAGSSKGIHFYHLAPEFHVNNFVRLLPGLDIRGDRGLIVAPPSMHQSGKRYQWREKRSIQPLPGYLRDLVKPKEILRTSQAKPNNLPASGGNEGTARYFNEQCNRIGATQPGFRNATLFAGAIMAGHFVRDGRMSRLDAESGLLQAGLSAGLSETEVNRTIQSGINRGIADPKR